CLSQNRTDYAMGSEEKSIDTDQQPLVHYESPDGAFHSFTLDAAQTYYQSGYFISDTKFMIAQVNADANSEEWRVWALGELIERNGRSAPFLMYTDENRRKTETLSGLKEELVDLENRRAVVLDSIQPLFTRLDIVQAEIRQIEERIDSSHSLISHEEDPQMDQSKSYVDNPVEERPNFIASTSEETVAEGFESEEMKFVMSIEPAIDDASFRRVIDADSNPTARESEEMQVTMSVFAEVGDFTMS
ncbi:hypothetical protein PMAYCL1PPCAC_08136, partial [Pristionchus mayeri]